MQKRLFFTILLAIFALTMSAEGLTYLSMLCSAQPGEREGEEGQEFFTKRSQHSNTVLTIIFTV